MDPIANLTDDELRSRARIFLRRFFGYSSFRPMQEEIVMSTLRGRDGVVLMPTGGGKSITFQIPALMLPGVTVVVSPLLSLMRDQVESLIANGIPAATINSLQSESDNRAVADALAAGKVKLLYMSPERLLADMPRWGDAVKVSLIAIDEAHCISRWGHDFRPDYTRLSEIRSRWPGIPIVALTATADRLTRDDIASQLRLREPAVFISSFDRPNLSLNVMAAPSASRRYDAIESFLRRHPRDTGIVYCLARKTTETVAAELARRGYRVAHYHAAMPPEARMKVQTLFRSGALQAVVATVAFGMGIDKSNIRWVVHYNMPSCIESYYQEIGRAGRDGMPSETLMFYSIQDLLALRHFAEESGQSAVNLEKLKRMGQYAEARVCRRRILLSYFGQTLDHDCGNCDVCRNPPARYDGSVPVRKALSAMVRTGEQVGVSMLVDILRGSNRADLVAKGYDRIKTYGSGRDIDSAAWQGVILQMLQLGLVDVAYDQGRRLRLTPYGRELLFSSEPVMLAREEPVKASGARRRKEPQSVSRPDMAEMLRNALFSLRNEIAARDGIAGYMVLDDRTVAAIVAAMPRTIEEFASIEGVSDSKATNYWSLVAKRIASVVKSYRPVVEPSRNYTLFLLRRGNTPAEIALTRHLKTATVYGHLADFAAAGALTDADVAATVSPRVYVEILGIMRRCPENPSAPFRKAPKDAAPNPLAERYPAGLTDFVLEVARSRKEI